MEYKLKTYSIWDCGKRVDADGNPHQEDNMFPAHGQAKDTDRLFILCDGMGGHEAGEVASAAVCGALSESILGASSDPEAVLTDEMFQRALSDAFDALDAKDTGISSRKMGTTMTFLKLYSGGALIAHMGDSRVYHIRPGRTAEDTQVLFKTRDHSLLNDLLRAGELTEEEAKTFSRKNVITRAMQPGMETRPKADLHRVEDIRPGDYFYLCSDGMLENMDDRQLCYFFSDEAGNDDNKVKSLLMATRENRDNHSAIIVHILDAPAHTQAGAYTSSFSSHTSGEFIISDSSHGSASHEKSEPYKIGQTPASFRSLLGRKKIRIIILFIILILFLAAALVLCPTGRFYRFKKAADTGDAEAQYKVGLCYYNGKGTKQDYDKAAHWFELSSAQHYGPAEYQMGICYLNGHGVKKNSKNAYIYFNRAKNDGYESSADNDV